MAYNRYSEGTVQHELTKLLQNINSIFNGNKRIELAEQTWNGRKDTSITVKEA